MHEPLPAWLRLPAIFGLLLIQAVTAVPLWLFGSMTLGLMSVNEWAAEKRRELSQ